MVGIGTLLNMAGIIVGGGLGLTIGNRISDAYRQMVMTACGICLVFIGAAGVLAEMLVFKDGRLVSTGAVTLLICMSAGSFLGELIDIEGRVLKVGSWLRAHSGNSYDARFINAFVSASLMVSIGSLAVMGPLSESIYGDSSLLITKTVIDFLTIMVITIPNGKGCLFAAIPMGIIQGLITLLGMWFKASASAAVLSNIVLTGSVMIFCVGLNLAFDKKIRVSNMFPAIGIGILYACIPW